MPPKKTLPRWGNDKKEAILTGFCERGWNPEEKEGTMINKILKLEPDLLKVLKPFFSLNKGGTKTMNNQLYQHYKDIGCEFIVAKTHDSFHCDSKSDGAFAFC